MRKFNLWEKPIERILRTIAKGSVVIVVFDTDVSGQMDLFVSNVRTLAKSAQRVILLERDNNIAKVWIDPIRLYSSGGFNRTEISKILKIIESKREIMTEAWNDYFGS